MQIGVTGGNGMLGTDIVSLLKSKAFNVRAFVESEYDLTMESNIRKICNDVDVLINCAAYTAVDKAESEKELCYAVNAEAVGLLGKHIAEQGKYIIHFSTDFVFGDNSHNPLNEESPTKPLNVYGSSKLEGERLLQQSGAKHSIIRVEWTYGNNRENFITKIVELASRLDELKVVDDQFGAPTYTADIAQIVLPFVENEIEGLFHYAADGFTSRYETAIAILEILGLKNEVSPCPTSAFTVPAKRPLNSRFDCSKIDKTLGLERPHWKNSLKKYLKS